MFNTYCNWWSDMWMNSFLFMMPAFTKPRTQPPGQKDSD